MSKLIERAKNYKNFDENERRAFIKETYTDMNLSYAQIAEMTGTYPNRIRRDALAAGIASRNKSQAQSVALQEGRHKHPTKGRKHKEESRIRISDSLYNSWSNLPQDERDRRADLSKEQWDNMTEEEKAEFRKKAGDAVRQASRDGSKLEKYLLGKLVNAGYSVDFHKEHSIANEKLHIDLYLPKNNVAIEVDGPSHFKDIWGKQTLERNQRADREKSGLLIGRGLVLIRVKQSRPLSEKFKRNVATELLEALEKIKVSFPPLGERLIEIGE